MSGTVSVAVTPDAATWSLRGPGTFNGGSAYSGSGDESLVTQPAGEYRVFWNTVEGYTPPRVQAGTLADDGTLTLTGAYIDEDLDHAPLLLARTMLSECANFQTFVGAEDATEALASIYLDIEEDTDANLGANRPCAYIMFEGAERRERFAHGTRDWFKRTGAVKIALEKDAEDGDAWTALAAFTTETGPIVRELSELSGTEGYLSFASLERGEPTRASHEEAEAGNDFFFVEIVCQYG